MEADEGGRWEEDEESLEADSAEGAEGCSTFVLLSLRLAIVVGIAKCIAKAKGKPKVLALSLEI